MGWKDKYCKSSLGVANVWYVPKGKRPNPPDEGWKLHVSGTAKERDQIMDAIHEILLGNTPCTHKVSCEDDITDNKLCAIYGPTKYALKQVAKKLRPVLVNLPYQQCVLKAEHQICLRLFARYGRGCSSRIFNHTREWKFEDPKNFGGDNPEKPPWIREWDDTIDDDYSFNSPPKSEKTQDDRFEQLDIEQLNKRAARRRQLKQAEKLMKGKYSFEDAKKDWEDFEKKKEKRCTIL